MTTGPEILTEPTPTQPHAWRNIRFEVLERIESLPSLNSVVVEFLELTRREYFTAKDFEQVICKDQALVARLLRLANSGLYGWARGVHAIPEAVVLIGLENLKKIVFAVSAEGLTRRRLERYAYHPDQGFWVHSLATAHIARALAEASPGNPLRPEEAFVGGLLHDVGKLVIDEFLPEEGPRWPASGDEMEAVGLTHAELGGFILRQWNLPESIAECVLHHHDFAGAGEWAAGACVIALAEEITDFWGLGHEENVDVSEPLPLDRLRPYGDALGIPEDRWNPVVWEIQQSMSTMAEAFDMDPVKRGEEPAD